MSPLDPLAAALGYAEQGLAVLRLHAPAPAGCSCRAPDCSAVGKHPATPRGLHDATTDPGRIRRWWTGMPHANVGLRTGEHLDALDLDGSDGVHALRDAAGPGGGLADLVAAPVVRTGHGWHYLFAPTGQGNRTRLLPGVDWRGRGGYIVAPPSRHATGARYTWLRPLHRPLPDPPGWLHELLTPRREPAAVAPLPGDPDHPYAQAALRRECRRVAHAPHGQRNDTLYRAGLKLHSLAAGGLLDPHQVDTLLLDAAQHCELPTREAHATIASARRTAQLYPRNVPADPLALQRGIELA